MHTKSFLICGLAAALLAVAGCETRSISNSGFQPHHYGGTRSQSSYRGELNEFEVLGVHRETDRERGVTEEEIRQALDTARRVKIKRGASVLLIQSGATFPDGPMVGELGKHFSVSPFSGVPPERGKPGSLTNNPVVTDFARSLRLAAARGANEAIICYWGILESGRQDLATKTVSWVPVVSWVTPDQREHMRLRLKLAVIDVRTGNWNMLSPEPFADTAISTRHLREQADQNLVNRLKEQAYEAAVRELLKACVD